MIGRLSNDLHHVRGRATLVALLALLAACSDDGSKGPVEDAQHDAHDLAGPADTSPSKPPLLLDVNMGLDDARVILALPGQQTFEVKGIVTVEGSAGAAKGADNALRLLAALGVDTIPVAVGVQQAILGPISPPSWRSMAESLGGVSLPAAQREVEPTPGVDFIAKVLRDSPQPVRVLAIGPLTNLALVLDKDPSLAKQIHSLYLLGDFQGCTSYNCSTDLEAAKKVFALKLPTVVVGSSATDKAPFDAAFLSSVQALGSRAGKLVAAMMANHSSGEMKLWDDSVLATALDEQLVTFQKLDAATQEVVDIEVVELHTLLLYLWRSS